MIVPKVSRVIVNEASMVVLAEVARHVIGRRLSRRPLHESDRIAYPGKQHYGTMND